MLKANLLSLGEWSWDARSRRLSISTDANSGIDRLDGVWSVEALAHMLDGLSERRLRGLLDPSSTPAREASCVLSLSDGGKVRLSGTFETDGSAVGLVMRDLYFDPEIADQPGPELRPVFQPILSLGTGDIAGFEALARWHPGEQIRTSREPHGDDGLAAHMLMQSGEALASWQTDYRRADLFINVNVTAEDLARGDLDGLVRDLVEGYGFNAGQLRVELTEQAALRDAGQALDAALRLKEAGAGLILDDFGSGHSSFAWLETFPADGLKVDADLIARLGSERMQTILASITRLASDLGMSATAEGVENLDDIGLIRRLGFGFAQGFAFAHPLGAEDAGALLDA
jgi:EAL domain-containing protein (putative c-di-GMP-specific phosphodiesterase class I)